MVGHLAEPRFAAAIRQGRDSRDHLPGSAAISQESAEPVLRLAHVPGELLQLATRMVDSSESGREQVLQTIQAMDAIRLATETADTVIRGLGERAKEIGAILNVIDDVADETALLALLRSPRQAILGSG